MTLKEKSMEMNKKEAEKKEKSMEMNKKKAERKEAKDEKEGG
jgi:hypothetical protein